MTDAWLQPLATVLSALIVGTAAFLTLRQRTSADAAELRKEREALAHARERDRRQHWWVRAQWAVDLSLSPDDVRRRLGTRALQLLADEQADPDDLALLLLAVEQALDEGARMATADDAGARHRRQAARVSAARAYAHIAGRLSRPVDPDVARLARLPEDGVPVSAP